MVGDGRRKLSLRAAGAQYGMAPSTLATYVKVKRDHGAIVPLPLGRPPIFNTEMENLLVKWAKAAGDAGREITTELMLSKAHELRVLLFAESSEDVPRPTRSWLRRVLHRHNDLHLGYGEPYTAARARANTDANYTDFYRVRDALISKLQATYHLSLTAENFYNMDETSLHGRHRRLKTLSSTEYRAHKKVLVDILNARIQLVACGSASGVVIPPMIVVPTNVSKVAKIPMGARAALQRGGVMLPLHRGRLDSDGFQEWVKHFLHMAPRGVRPIVLVMDNASFHQADAVLKELVRNSVYPLFLPGSTTDRLQPLDVEVFNALHAKIHSLLVDFHKAHVHEEVTKFTVAEVASKAYWSAMDHLPKGFFDTGIWPLNAPRAKASLHFTEPRRKSVTATSRQQSAGTYSAVRSLFDDGMSSMPNSKGSYHVEVARYVTMDEIIAKDEQRAKAAADKEAKQAAAAAKREARARQLAERRLAIEARRAKRARAAESRARSTEHVAKKPRKRASASPRASRASAKDMATPEAVRELTPSKRRACVPKTTATPSSRGACAIPR